LVALLGRDSGIQLNLIIGAVAVLGLDYLALGIATIVLCLLLHITAWFLFPVGLVAVEQTFLRNSTSLQQSPSLLERGHPLTTPSGRPIEPKPKPTSCCATLCLRTLSNGCARTPIEPIADAFGDRPFSRSREWVR
jgi:hypothetical protein